MQTSPGVHPAWARAPVWVRVLIASVAALTVAPPLVSASGQVPLFRDEAATVQLATLALPQLLSATDHADRILLPHLLVGAGAGVLALLMAVSALLQPAFSPGTCSSCRRVPPSWSAGWPVRPGVARSDRATWFLAATALGPPPRRGSRRCGAAAPARRGAPRR